MNQAQSINFICVILFYSLHLCIQACELQAPYAVVKALIESFEPAVRMRDYLCRLPLHIACLCRASYDVIALLLDAYVDATRIPDDAGCIPLHYACRKGINEKVIQRLLTLNHRGAYSTDSYSLLPIHWACKYSASLAVVECLLRAHPHSVDCLDQFGRSPMDVAKQIPNHSEKAAVIEALGRNASYWTMSLVHEVEMLKKELVQLGNTMKQSSACRDDEIDRLQKLLDQVTQASAEVTRSFKVTKSELEYENASLKNQVKRLTQESMIYEERIESLTTDNNHLNKEMEVLDENLKNENMALKEDLRKMKEDAFNYKKQMIELFDDNVRLTHEVNRLTERLDSIAQQMKDKALNFANGQTNIGDIFHCG